MGDAFPDPLEKSLKALQSSEAEIAAKVKVTQEQCFVGFDAYQKVIESGVDVVLLATPPGFRPLHLQAAVAAGKHIFAEKPWPWTPRAYARCWPARRRRSKRISRSWPGFVTATTSACARSWSRSTTARSGTSARSTRLQHGRALVQTAQPEWTDMEWQLRNWYVFHVALRRSHHRAGGAQPRQDGVADEGRAAGDVAWPSAAARCARLRNTATSTITSAWCMIIPTACGRFIFAGSRANTTPDNSDHVMGADGVGHIVRAFTGPYVIRAKPTGASRGTKGARHVSDRAQRIVRLDPQRQADQ
jgi:hypothetical protein